MQTNNAAFAGCFFVGALAIGLSCAGCARSDSHPNILIISADTLNRSALRVFDESAQELPAIESLASESVVFDRAYTPSSWTLPAHASLLTGLYPDRHGATREGLRIASNVDTLADHLHAAGYETVGFSGGGFVDGSLGFDEGFDRFNDKWKDPSLCCLQLPRDGKYDELSGRELFDRALAYLDERVTQSPFFLFLQTYSIHDYYQLHPWITEEFPGRRFESADYYSQCLCGDREGTDEDWQALRDLYRAEVRHFDDGVGRLLAKLDELGLRKSTLIVLLSDHGEGLSPELGRIHHGGRLNADLIRVPVLVAGPGITPGARKDALSLVDMMPTLLDHLGLEVPAGLDGISLAQALHGGEKLDDRPIFAQEFMYAWLGGVRKEALPFQTKPVSVAVIGEGRWYIKNAAASEELYDYKRDPKQLHNLVDRTDELERFRELSEERDRYEAPTELAEDYKQLEQRLEQLGYTSR